MPANKRSTRRNKSVAVEETKTPVAPVSARKKSTRNKSIAEAPAPPSAKSKKEAQKPAQTANVGKKRVAAQMTKSTVPEKK